MSDLGPITPIPIPAAELPNATILLFGGTFDPVHKAHVELADEARQWIDNEQRRSDSSGPEEKTWLLFVPVVQSPHKSGSQPGASALQRIEMLRLATSKVPRAAVWTDEVDRAGRGTGLSYTIDTVSRAREWLDSQSASGTRLRLLIGADQAAAFHTWRSPRQILEHAPPLVMMRSPREDREAMAAMLRATGAWSEADLGNWKAGLAPTRVLNVTATDLRQAIAAGKGRSNEAASQLHPRVLQFIQDQGLYSGRS